MTISAERWRLTETIFHEVEAVGEPERTAILTARCDGDTELMAELRSLLDACEAVETRREAFAGEPDEEEVSRRVGPYQIDELLGRGGMGAVYLAHRADGQFKQQVAIKIIDMPLATELFRERFRTERQILAGLSHPYIARLLDGGVSETGELYLAMEYVDGVAITRFCEQRQFGISARLELFRKVCEAVQYAHQNLIVHRDLKPDNILVVEDGTPRLLDFGTAKILTQVTPDADSRDATRAGLQMFTPRYASPEQVLGQLISIASDTYSLGVLLYRLLTNEQPYELTDFTTEEMIRVVCGQEPRRPSLAGAPYGKLDADLDSIVLKALRKEPQGRYATVDQFSADIQAYLEGRPVLARSGDLRYRVGKFVRRNRLALAGAVLLLVVLVAGVAGILWQSRVANLQRRKAEARSADLRQLSDSLLTELDDAIKQLPGSTSAQKLLVTRVLDHLDRMSADGADDELTQLDLADAYVHIGNLEGNPYEQNIDDAVGGLASIDKAIKITEQFKAQHPKDTVVLHAYGMAEQSRSEILYGMGKTQQAMDAMKLAAATFDQLASLPGATSLNMSEAATAFGGIGDEMGQIGHASLGDIAGALKFYQKALEFQRRALALDPKAERARRSLPISLMKIGNMLSDTDPWQALQQFRLSLQAMDNVPETYKTSFPYKRSRAYMERRLGMLMFETGDFPGAIAQVKAARAVNETFAKADPQDGRSQVDLVTALENEASCYEAMLDPVSPADEKSRKQYRLEAVALLQRATTILEAELKRNSHELTSQASLANMQVRMGTLQQALGNRSGRALADKGLAALRQLASAPDALAFVLDDMANSQLLMAPVATVEARAAIEFSLRAIKGNHNQKANYLLTLSQAYRAAGDLSNARQTAREGLALLAPIRPKEPKTHLRKLLELAAS